MVATKPNSLAKINPKNFNKSYKSEMNLLMIVYKLTAKIID